MEEAERGDERRALSAADQHDSSATGVRAHGTYRPDIDGLRAVSVLAVVIYHLEPRWLPGGFCGVDVFFVISGYVVSHSLLNHGMESPMSRILLNFYARRVRRLLPALLTMIIAVSVAMSIVVEPTLEGNDRGTHPLKQVRDESIFLFDICS